MYNDTIQVANKIITVKSLIDIFSLMNERMIYYKKIAEMEERNNKVLSYSYQKWTFKDYGSALTFKVNFYDDTNIKFDNYNQFLSVFQNRLSEIKCIMVSFNLNYIVFSPEESRKYYYQHINMNIYEAKMNIDVSLSSEDKKIDDIYDLIKSKVLKAPIKYDDLIRKRKSIYVVVDFAMGFIPAFVLTLLLLLVPTIRQVFAASYILYPICCLFLTFFIGSILGSAKLDYLYKSIIPSKKYSGYDINKHKSIYKDDMDKYLQTSEILIGRNSDNLKCRKQIFQCYSTYKKFIPIEVILLVVVSILVVIL